MTCERTGMQFRSSEMRKEWTGIWVHESVLNYRHPQDFVTGTEDNQTVPVSRPDVEQVMGETTLIDNVLTGNFEIFLETATGLSEDDAIGIVMDNGAVTWTFIDEITEGEGRLTFAGEYPLLFDGEADLTFAGVGETLTITLGSPMLGDAASGNVVYLPSLNNENWV